MTGGLVLTRKLGEQVVVGDDLTITVVSIKGNRVQLRFTSQHKDLPIIKAENHPKRKQ